MRLLTRIKLTTEQLKVVNLDPVGERLIRGSAGSGKTTVAIYRLVNLAKTIRDDKNRVGNPDPTICCLLTFNRTLKGYISALVRDEKRFTLGSLDNIELSVSTFDKWAKDTVGSPSTLFYLTDKHDKNSLEAQSYIYNLAKKSGLKYSSEFLISEIAYVLGRFPSDQLAEYLTQERTGRGGSPRVDSPARKMIIDTVIPEYVEWKQKRNVIDGEDLAILMSNYPEPVHHDIFVVDECQDFTANRMRAIKHFLRPSSACLTMVMDSAQRIYRHGFTWKEVGINVSGGDRVVTLSVNHRNTKEIAIFVSSVLADADIGADGVIPNPAFSERTGEKPRVLEGTYLDQVDWAIADISAQVDLKNETVAFLHPNGWFRDLMPRLKKQHIQFVELTRIGDWPQGEENVALLTMSSAKGLEFDHVYILGLDNSLTNFGPGKDDDELHWQIRRFAVACSRARKTLTIGYKKEESSFLVALADKTTYVVNKL